MTEDNNTRGFSYSNPVRYGGYDYPATQANLLDSNGNASKTNVFADANGQYFVLGDNGVAKPVMPVHTLDEVVVTPNRENLLSDAFNKFLAQSNDSTQVLNTPHREYNPHLKDSAIQGALSHNLWEQEHPNLSAWSQVFAATPFAVASAPLVGALGQATLSTTAGQAVRSGISSLMANPLVDAANTGLGLGFAAKGAYDASQSNFTPETALDLAGGAGLMFKSLTGLRRARRAANLANTTEGTGPLVDTPLYGKTEIPMDIKADAAKRYTDFINSDDYQSRLQRAGLEDHWSYMKKLTDDRINRSDYFPGSVKDIIDNDPRVEGISLPYDGIVLKSSLPEETIPPVLNHEVAHWATHNVGTNHLMNWIESQAYGENVTPIGDIMRYNENLVYNKPWSIVKEQIKQGDKVIKNKKGYKYLTLSQEKRARAYSIYQQAKDSGMSTDEFVDFYTTDKGNIAKYAPIQLRQMGAILTPNNLKKYLRNFLSVGMPIGITTPYLNLDNK